MIKARGLTKRYGETTAVDDLSFTVRPGVVTGFLGPNGAGKSTTMRMILGLDAPTEGKVTVNGRLYAEHRAPLTEVGALLEARAVHTNRTAIDHLHAMAATTGIGRRRVEEVIDLVGLHEVLLHPRTSSQDAPLEPGEAGVSGYRAIPSSMLRTEKAATTASLCRLTDLRLALRPRPLGLAQRDCSSRSGVTVAS
jgi:ABC-type transport system involved in cytochrome bd biosynthesis fused ATPase/permease subunit